MDDEKQDHRKFALIDSLGREDRIEREFWEAAYVAAIIAGVGSGMHEGIADTALRSLRARRTIL